MPGIHAVLAEAVLQAWLGMVGPLTTLESWLRRRAGEGAYEARFIQHWLRQLRFVDAPWWGFALAYSGFALLVAAAWWRWPPRR